MAATTGLFHQPGSTADFATILTERAAKDPDTDGSSE